MTRTSASGPRPRRTHLSIQRSVSVGFVVVSVLLLVAAAVAAGSLQGSTTATNRLADHIFPAARDAGQLQTVLLDQETGLRGYLLTGDRQFLQPYQEGQREQGQIVTRMRRLLADDPSSRADLEDVVRRASTWRQQYAEPALAARPHAATAGSVVALATRGKVQFDRIRQALTTQQQHLDADQRAARAALAQAALLRTAALVAILAILALTAVIMFWRLRTDLVRPLRGLGEHTRLVADGDFRHEVRGSGATELKALGADIDGMRQRILAELDRGVEDQLLLKEQAQELRRSNAELEQFAYVASHDLQEPLRKVASFCQLLERRYSDKLDDSARQYIAFAVDGAKRMQVLINDLLTFSRVGRLHDRREPVKLDDTLQRGLRNLGGSLEDSDAEVVFPDELPTVTGDQTLLTMVWQNLIGNALKFHEPDRAPRVVIDCEQSEAECRITVTDNGIGIDPQFADKIFVIFQRLHSRDNYGGTGIGLALCRKIVEHHGGRIWLDTEYSGGTRFIMTLPVLVPETEEAEETGPGGDGPGSVGTADVGAEAPDVVVDRGDTDVVPTGSASAEPGGAETGRAVLNGTPAGSRGED